MNKQGNTYTILYASIMVVIVAALLAIVSVSLKPMQQANIEIDKKKQILTSVNLAPTTQNAVELYGKYIIGCRNNIFIQFKFIKNCFFPCSREREILSKIIFQGIFIFFA